MSNDYPSNLTRDQCEIYYVQLSLVDSVDEPESIFLIPDLTDYWYEPDRQYYSSKDDSGAPALVIGRTMGLLLLIGMGASFGESPANQPGVEMSRAFSTYGLHGLNLVQAYQTKIEETSTCRYPRVINGPDQIPYGSIQLP